MFNQLVEIFRGEAGQTVRPSHPTDFVQGVGAGVLVRNIRAEEAEGTEKREKSCSQFENYAIMFTEKRIASRWNRGVIDEMSVLCLSGE